MSAPAPHPFAALDHLPVSVFQLDREGRILHANRWVCDLLGVSLADSVGRRCPDFGMPGDVWAEWKEAVAVTFDTGRTGQYEFLSSHGDEERLVEYRFAPHPADGHGPPSVWVVALTISELLQLRRKLREQERLFQAFLNRAPAFAWLRDAAGRYRFVNGSYSGYFDVGPEDRVGRALEDVWPPELAARLRAGDEQVLASGKDLRVLEEVPGRGGRTREWVSLKFPFVGEDGRQYVGGLGVDMTDQRVADARAARAAKLESLGLLAAGAAHDFNNLLTVVMGQATMGLREVPADSPVAERLRDIQAAGERAGELCEQMLAFSGRRRSTPVDVNLAVVAHDTARLTRAVLPPSATLHIDIPPDPVVVHADPTHLRQVVLNLITNAADAMAGRDGDVRVGVTAAGGKGVLTVSDQGCGMTPDTSARVFEPFFTTKPHGHGLGLAAVHGLVHSLGGEIGVRSAVNVGTTFRVEFPLAAPTPDSATAAAANIPGHIG